MTTIIRFGDLTRAPWPNGAGEKADILADADWSISYAWLERDAPFSDFTGHARTITLLEGPGFTLRFPKASTPDLTVDTPLSPTPFDGGWPTRAEVPGPCVVLNVFTRRAAFTHQIDIVTGPASIAASPDDVTLVVALRGSPILGGHSLDPHDALRITQDTAIAEGTVAVIKISKASQ